MGIMPHGLKSRTDYIRKLGFSYADMEKTGIISPVTDLNIKYKKSIFILKSNYQNLG